MNLCIDIGNTRVKTGLFSEEKLLEKEVYESLDPDLIGAVARDKNVRRMIVSSVKESVDTLANALAGRFEILELTSDTPLPFVNRYATPLTLGKDRLAAVAGARALFPGEHCLVVDCGTCIKYEMMDAAGVYHGGNIAPGAWMRIQAMHHFTARLPEVSMKLPENAIGNSTETALQNGALRGAALEIEGFIREFEKKFIPLRVIFSGGDGAFFYAMPEFSACTLEPDLNLHGLNKILNFNKINT